MAITLAKLCADTEKKYNMKLIAGEKGLENTVRWVHMIEDREVPGFLHGNELLFTTGIGHLSGGASLIEFVKKLKEHNAVGIVVNLGPYIAYVPENVIQYCRENDFPIFTLPWEIRIIDITFDFCRRIIENEKHEVSVAQAFKNVIASPSDMERYKNVFEKSGFSSSGSYRVLMMDFFTQGEKVTSSAESNNYMKLWKILTISKYQATMFLHDNKLIVIRQNSGYTEMVNIMNTLTSILKSVKLDVVAGISDESRGYESIPLLYKQAFSAYLSARADGKSSVFYNDIGIYKLIFGIENKTVLESFINGILFSILHYDKENGTDYEKTLKDYLESGCSVKQVAESCGVHRNTINYKIKQIRELFHLELNEKEKTEFIIAYKAKEVMKYLLSEESK